MSIEELIDQTHKIVRQYEQGLLTPQDYRRALWILALRARS